MNASLPGDSAPALAAGVCPYRVARPVMVQRWETLSFLHWPVDGDLVQALLPPGLSVETQEGTAWVGLVPFFMRVAVPGTGSVPWLSRFCETNVRAYVRDEAGRSGIWFFSLDAARLGAVLAARVGFRLPYFWSRMSLAHDGHTVRYACRRRWPAGGPASDVRVEVGTRYADDELRPLDHFLTARWTLFSRTNGWRRFVNAEHRPWPLWRARAVEWDDGLVVAAGLPSPSTEPLVHFSEGVAVRIGRPRRPGS